MGKFAINLNFKQTCPNPPDVLLLTWTEYRQVQYEAPQIFCLFYSINMKLINYPELIKIKKISR